MSVEDWQLAEAVPISNWRVPVLRVASPSEDGAPDDAVVTDIAAPVFSPRLQRALMAAGVEGVQYLPIKIARYSGALLDGFAIANVLVTRRALNLERSLYSTYPTDYFLAERRGEIRSVYRYVLDAAVLSGCDLLRLGEYKVALLCSERVKKVFDDNDFTGWGFEPVEVIYTTH